jgi:hypothetical protein
MKRPRNQTHWLPCRRSARAASSGCGARKHARAPRLRAAASAQSGTSRTPQNLRGSRALSCAFAAARQRRCGARVQYGCRHAPAASSGCTAPAPRPAPRGASQRGWRARTRRARRTSAPQPAVSRAPRRPPAARRPPPASAPASHPARREQQAFRHSPAHDCAAGRRRAFSSGTSSTVTRAAGTPSTAQAAGSSRARTAPSPAALPACAPRRQTRCAGEHAYVQCQRGSRAPHRWTGTARAQPRHTQRERQQRARRTCAQRQLRQRLLATERMRGAYMASSSGCAITRSTAAPGATRSTAERAVPKHTVSGLYATPARACFAKQASCAHAHRTRHCARSARRPSAAATLRTPPSIRARPRPQPTCRLRSASLHGRAHEQRAAPRGAARSSTARHKARGGRGCNDNDTT